MNLEFIMNPIAGNGKTQDTWTKIRPFLDDIGINYKLHVTTGPGDAGEIAYSLANNVDNLPPRTVIVSVGGDGTLHEIINGLCDNPRSNQQIPVAVIPSGTGNDFARAYGISNDPQKALQAIINTRSITQVKIAHYIDSANDASGYFVNNIGIGYDAMIVNHTNHSQLKRVLNKIHLGSISYAGKGIEALIEQKSFKVKLENMIIPNAYFLVAYNHPFIGGGVTIDPNADITGNNIDLLVAQRGRLVPLVTTIKLALGQLPNAKLAFHFYHHRLHYRTFSPQYIQADGVELGKKAANLTIKSCHYPFMQLRNYY